MKNEIRFILEPKQRPKLAQEIGKILGTAPHYEWVPKLCIRHFSISTGQRGRTAHSGGNSGRNGGTLNLPVTVTWISG